MTISCDIKILLVEDAATMRKIEIKTLNTLGYRNILEAEDGEVGAQIIQAENGVDLIISDWNMPRMGGYELLVWLRQQEAYKGTPFLMATGQADRMQARKALDAGANGLIAKPFSAGELKSKIEEAMGVRSPWEEESIAVGPQIGASGKVKLRVGHIQITDHLALGVLKHWITAGEVVPNHFELETSCMPGWNQVQQAVDKGQLDAACILAPIAMDMYNDGVPIKLILFAHRNGSVCVRSSQGDFSDPYQDFFKKRSFLIPHKLSIHHMLTHIFFDGIGLKASMEKGADVDVNLEIVAPVNMPEFVRDNAEACGFMVAEPIGSKSVAAGIAKRQFLSSELWQNHPCCVVTVRDDFSGSQNQAVHEFTQLLVKAGQFIDQNPEAAAGIAVGFLDPEGKLGLQQAVLRNVLQDPQGIKTADLYPAREDIDKMQQYMVNIMNVGSLVDLNSFVDTQYADLACQGLARGASTFLHTSAVVQQLLKPRDPATAGKGRAAQSATSIEGRYLTFVLANQEYGINILKVKEIIKMMDFVAVHNVPSYAKGVINLRGRVIPVIDLRAKLGMDEVAYTDRSCIIIIEAEQHGVFKPMGVAVDSVSEVLTIKASEVDNPPAFGEMIDTNYILGMAKSGSSVKILLDIDRALH